jgi:DNA-binding transcriptional ArsR family regulator
MTIAGLRPRRRWPSGAIIAACARLSRPTYPVRVTRINFELLILRLTYISNRLLILSIANRLLILMLDARDILFRSLADPTRRAIFERLCREGEQTVGALTAQSGVSQPAVSKHLGVLKQAGLVCDRHEGRQTHYSAQLGALAPLIDWTTQMTGFWQRRFDHLEDLLKRMDQ